MALGSILVAEVGLAVGNLDAAARHASAAVDLVQAAGLPPAAIRVNRTTARIYKQQGKTGAAGKCRIYENETREQLARCLEAAPHLQDALLRGGTKVRRTSAPIKSTL